MFPSHIHTYSFIHLQSVDSTNNYTATNENQPNIQHKTVIMASFQSEGKGQFHNKWQSKANENLLCSIYIRPKSLVAEQQFDLSRISALAIRDCISHFLPGHASIKWPNDIYIKGKKIAGILIENSVTKNKIDRSIIGIGININQEKFDGINATSFVNESNQKWDLMRILEFLLYRFDYYLEALSTERKLIQQTFDIHLLHRKDWIMMKSSKGEFKGRIVGTAPTGQLIVEDDKSNLIQFNHKEIEFMPIRLEDGPR